MAGEKVFLSDSLESVCPDSSDEGSPGRHLTGHEYRCAGRTSMDKGLSAAAMVTRTRAHLAHAELFLRHTQEPPALKRQIVNYE